MGNAKKGHKKTVRTKKTCFLLLIHALYLVVCSKDNEGNH